MSRCTQAARAITSQDNTRTRNSAALAGSKGLHYRALNDACGCEGRRYIGKRDRNGAIDAKGITVVETVGSIAGEDAVRRQRRHAHLHRSHVKRAAAAAVDVLALSNE